MSTSPHPHSRANASAPRRLSQPADSRWALLLCVLLPLETSDAAAREEPYDVKNIEYTKQKPNETKLSLQTGDHVVFRVAKDSKRDFPLGTFAGEIPCKKKTGDTCETSFFFFKTCSPNYERKPSSGEIESKGLLFSHVKAQFQFVGVDNKKVDLVFLQEDVANFVAPSAGTLNVLPLSVSEPSPNATPEETKEIRNKALENCKKWEGEPDGEFSSPKYEKIRDEERNVNVKLDLLIFRRG